MQDHLYRKVTILGAGLLGGSLGLSIRAHMPECHVVAWGRRDKFFSEIIALGAADEVTTDLPRAVQGADLVVFSTPVGVMPVLAQTMKSHLAPGVMVTDVGSVKRVVHEFTAPLLTKAGIAFVGSHPMAGSEKQGISAAREDLFQNAPLVLTNDEGVAEDKVEKLRQFWRRMGCRCYEMQSADHDRSIAQISHLPHVLAAVCAMIAIPEGRERQIGQLSGGGFRDTSRVCSGNPEMWSEILMENREALRPLIESSIGELSLLLQLLQSDEPDGTRPLEYWLAEARSKREKALAVNATRLK